MGCSQQKDMWGTSSKQTIKNNKTKASPVTYIHGSELGPCLGHKFHAWAGGKSWGDKKWSIAHWWKKIRGWYCTTNNRNLDQVASHENHWGKNADWHLDHWPPEKAKAPTIRKGGFCRRGALTAPWHILLTVFSWFAYGVNTLVWPRPKDV